MKVCVFNPVIEKGNCILRSLTKILEKDYFEVKNELNNFSIISALVATVPKLFFSISVSKVPSFKYGGGLVFPVLS